MTRYRNKICIFSFLLLLISHCTLHTAHCSLQERLQSAQTGRNWQEPGQKELIQVENLFKRLFAGEFGEELIKEAAYLDYDLSEIQESGRAYIILSENKSRKTGRGFYLFPRLKQGNKVLQMPHSFKDFYTGDIGLDLALEGNFSGAAWNTVPRYFTENDIRTDADLSDLFNTVFASFARAFAACYPESWVIQLHGFSKDKRTSTAGSGSDIILSSGNELSGLWMKNMDTCLEQKFSTSVSVYPLETKELGARKTSIGIILHQMGHKGFLHVEMSKPMRIMMRDKAEQRKKFLDCIQEVLP